MTELFFLSQIDRLKRRFGERHFDIEFIKLAAQEVRSMSELGFQRTVDAWIGSRPIHKYPLLTDFREARLAEDKVKLNNVTDGAADSFKYAHLPDLLKKSYGVDNVSDAIEFVRLKKSLAKIEDDDGPDDAV